MVTQIFALGLLVFISSAFIFFLLEKKTEYLAINRLVFFTTTVSYAVLLSGLWVNYLPNCQAIYPSRWLFYILSCGLLMYEIGIILKKDNLVKLQMIFFNFIVMITGFLASITLVPYKWLFLFISCAAFLIILMFIHQKTGKQTKLMNNVRWYVTITWSFFPIVWILAPTGVGLITITTTVFLYLLLDITTKICFACYVINHK